MERLVSYFSDFRVKSWDEVVSILEENDHNKVADHIQPCGQSYGIRGSIDHISPLPTFRFAVACALAALGNHVVADELISQPEAFVSLPEGDVISAHLALALKS